MIALVHTRQYIKEIQEKSGRIEGGYADEETTFSQYGFNIASLTVGVIIHTVEEVMIKRTDAAYVLLSVQMYRDKF